MFNCVTRDMHPKNPNPGARGRANLLGIRQPPSNDCDDSICRLISSPEDFKRNQNNLSVENLGWPKALKEISGSILYAVQVDES